MTYHCDGKYYRQKNYWADEFPFADADSGVSRTSFRHRYRFRGLGKSFPLQMQIPRVIQHIPGVGELVSVTDTDSGVLTIIFRYSYRQGSVDEHVEKKKRERAKRREQAEQRERRSSPRGHPSGVKELAPASVFGKVMDARVLDRVRTWIPTRFRAVARWLLESSLRPRLRSSLLVHESPDHRGPSKNKRPLKIKEQLQNKRHDVAYFLVYQWIGEARAARSAYFLK